MNVSRRGLGKGVAAALGTGAFGLKTKEPGISGTLRWMRTKHALAYFTSADQQMTGVVWLKLDALKEAALRFKRETDVEIVRLPSSGNRNDPRSVGFAIVHESGVYPITRWSFG